MITRTKNFIRSYILDHQLPAPRKGKEGTLKTIEQLGYVQIDTISVIKRAHHHVLWSRIPNYQSDYLKELTEKDRAVFDYWAHAASYLPMRDYRYSLFRKMEITKSDKHWYKKDPKNMAYVLDQIKQNGPLMSKDLKKGPFIKEEAWAIPPVKQALMHLFMEGKIMIAGRRGFQKIYDIPERILPPSVNNDLPSRNEYIEYVIRRDIAAHGLIQNKHVGHLLKISIKEKQTILDRMVKSDELETVKIKGLESLTYYAFSERIKQYSPSTKKKNFYILSPFDNLVILRKRVATLFDFSYTLECYVPAAKRKIGYFSLPLLYGKDFVGQIDLKADRKNKTLLIRNLVWEPGLKNPEKIYPQLIQKLKDFALFNNCSSIKAEIDDPILLTFSLPADIEKIKPNHK